MRKLRKFRTQNANAECRKRAAVGRRLRFSRFCIRILRSEFLWATALLLIVPACAKHETETKPVVSVRVAKAEIAPISQPIELVGVITARQEATVSPKIGGQIAQMALLKNRVVRAGEVLARIEARDVAAQRAEAAAAVATARDAIPPAEAALATARRTYERRAELYAKGGISKKDVEASQLDVANAAGALKTANGKVAEAQQHMLSFDAQLAYAEVRAPFDGVVTEQFLRQGDFAAAGTRLLTVADTSAVIIKAPLSDEQAARVHAGDAVTVQPSDLAGVSIPAHVDLVGRSADPQSRAVELWVTLPNNDGRLRVNGTARVVVASAGVPNAIVVPTSAVTLEATTANAGSVMVVDAQSIAHEVRVTTGAHTRDRTQIVSGLHGGETVVIEGNYGLPDGAKVQTAP
jgi:HlyD family secretion protein